MLLVPVFQTHIAELVLAVAGHVVAPLRLLNEHLAVRTPLPILEIALKIGIAWPHMLLEHALRTVLDLALLAHVVDGSIDDPVAVLGWTQFEDGVIHGLLPNFESIILALEVLGQIDEALGVDIYLFGTVLLGTGDLLHDVEFVHHIVAQTLMAEAMSAVADAVQFLIRAAKLAQLAGGSQERAPPDQILQVEGPLHLN